MYIPAWGPRHGASVKMAIARHACAIIWHQEGVTQTDTSLTVVVHKIAEDVFGSEGII